MKTTKLTPCDGAHRQYWHLDDLILTVTTILVTSTLKVEKKQHWSPRLCHITCRARTRARVYPVCFGSLRRVTVVESVATAT
mmetsp:Transcript_7214/g.20324  ORF Transcript_7214/g.20324 Transcript_7214/m.20324 type:complete len:82 (-) Transcript_7214:2310-2555(-)